MRTLLPSLTLLLTACTLSTAAAPFSDGGTSVDPATTPVLASCPSGSLVRKTSAGWDCVDPSTLSVSSATSATNAEAVQTATYALDAGYAASAGSAASAASAQVASYAADAGNALTLGGLAANQFLRADPSNANEVDMPGNLQLAGNRLLATAVRVDGGAVEMSLNALYCGVSAPTNGQLASIYGFATAKALCESACGKAYAHMCDVTEMLRSAQMGISMNAPDGGYAEAWVNSGISTLQTVAGQPTETNDCGGWTSANSSIGGAMWQLGPGGNYADLQSCNSLLPIACCE